MSVLSDELIESLINCSTQEKEVIGNRIVDNLGGDYRKKVTNLPPRRGNGDGGIDGRIPIIRATKTRKMRPDGTVLYDGDINEEEVEAAFCIKIENSKFDRYQLGAFKNDMERERIYEGIIISAKELSPDAKVELERINNDQQFNIAHIKIDEILNGNLECDFRFKVDLNIALKSSIHEFIEK